MDELSAFVQRLPRGQRKTRNLIRFSTILLSSILLAGGLYRIISLGDRIGGVTDIVISVLLTPTTFLLLFRNRIKQLYMLSAIVLLGGVAFAVFILIPTITKAGSLSILHLILNIVYAVLVVLTAGLYFFVIFRYRKYILSELRRQATESDESIALKKEDPEP